MTSNVGKRSNRKRSTSLLIVIAIALTTLVAVGVGTEFYARHKITSCLGDAVRGEIGGDVEVGLGARPLLLTALDNRVSSLSVDATNASIDEIGGATLKGITLRSTIRDIDLPASDGTCGSVGSSAATILGDGLVALILDIDSMLRLAASGSRPPQSDLKMAG